jgi:putative hydrolase of the HAD superfamily
MVNMSRIKAILLDLDNTLIDFFKMKKESCEAAVDAMRKSGLRANKKKAMKIMFEIMDEKGYEYKQLFQELLLRINGKIDWKLVAKGILAYREVQNYHLKPYKTVKPTLKKLRKKGYKLAIVSDAPVLKVWSRLVEMKLENLFDIVVTYEDTKKIKPHPAPFRAVLKKLGLKPEQVIFVGDSPSRDIAGAKKLGIAAVLAVYGVRERNKKYIKKFKPDYIINEFEEILKIV